MRCKGCDRAMVLHNGECHTCAIERAEKAEARVKELEASVEKLEQANIGADVRVAMMESQGLEREKYIKYIEEELEK